MTTVLSQQDGIYGFKFPKRFLEISSQEISIFSQLFSLSKSKDKDPITNPLVPFPFAFARLTRNTDMGAYILCAHLNFELRDCFITFPNFVPSQCLIVRIVRELFSYNRGVSHLNEACRIDDVSRGSLSCYEILTNN